MTERRKTDDQNPIEDDGCEDAYQQWRGRLLIVPAGDKRAFFAGWNIAKDRFQQSKPS